MPDAQSAGSPQWRDSTVNLLLHSMNSEQKRAEMTLNR